MATRIDHAACPLVVTVRQQRRAAVSGKRRRVVPWLWGAAVLALASALGAGCANRGGVPYEMRGWNRSFPPHHVIGNIYYVGSNEIAQFLVTTSAGHILLDSGFEASVPRLRANIEKLGFRMEDIKFLLSSHAHIDHAQAHATLRRLTGAVVVTSAADAPFIAGGGKGETVFDGIHAWAPCPVDRVVADQQQVTLGGTTLTAHLTPGHTRGAITWTMQVVDSRQHAGATQAKETEKHLAVVFFPSANVNAGVRLVGNTRYPNIAADFQRSFAIWKALPCDVFLGVHGAFYGMKQKYDRADAAPAANPFIDPRGYRHFVAAAEARFLEQLASEQ